MAFSAAPNVVADNVVNAPVAGVVAPTVPLMLILAVPVRFVTVPEEGVPNAPPLTTNAPELPVLTPSAVATPVPKEVMPVPPFATASVPPRVIAPVVALEGVRPVAPALNEVTAPVDETMMFAVEYHCVVLDALNSMYPPTTIEIGVLAPSASIAPPLAGKTLIGFAPLLTMIIRRPVVAVGSVTPLGLFDAVVTIL